MTRTQTAEVTLRPTTDTDRELLLAVYASTRVEELDQVEWAPGQREWFLQMQFDAQVAGPPAVDLDHVEAALGVRAAVLVVLGGELHLEEGIARPWWPLDLVELLRARGAVDREQVLTVVVGRRAQGDRHGVGPRHVRGGKTPWRAMLK